VISLEEFTRNAVSPEVEKDANFIGRGISKIRGKVWSLGSKARGMAPEARKAVSGMSPSGRKSVLEMAPKQQTRAIGNVIRTTAPKPAAAVTKARDIEKLRRRKGDLVGKLREKGTIESKKHTASVAEYARMTARKKAKALKAKELVKAKNEAIKSRQVARADADKAIPAYAAGGGILAGSAIASATRKRQPEQQARW